MSLRKPLLRGRPRGQSVVEFALVLPLLLVLLLAVADFARIYTTMLSVESAAREAADYGTFGAERWRTDSYAVVTVPEMQRRVCVATRNLADYAGPDSGCTNPTMSYCLTPSEGVACGPVDPVHACDNPNRENPCRLTVTVDYQFRPFAPLRIQMLGMEFGFPSSITVSRSSTFAMTDIQVAP
jgi:Flp pilus assembly protein TadG